MVIKKIWYKASFLVGNHIVLKISNLKVEGIGNLPKSSFILVANHEHQWDPFILWVLVNKHLKKNVHFFAGNFLFKGIRGYYLRKMEQIPVQSGLKELNESAFKKSKEYLKKGEIVGIFPYPFDVIKKKRVLYTGVIRLLRENNVPYVPVRIKIKEKWKSSYNKNLDNVDIYIGKPQKNKFYQRETKDVIGCTCRMMYEVNNL